MCLLLHADYKLLLWPMCFELSMQAYYFSWRVVFFSPLMYFFPIGSIVVVGHFQFAMNNFC